VVTAIPEAMPHSGNRLVAPGKRPKGVPPGVKEKVQNRRICKGSSDSKCSMRRMGNNKSERFWEGI